MSQFLVIQAINPLRVRRVVCLATALLHVCNPSRKFDPDLTSPHLSTSRAEPLARCSLTSGEQKYSNHSLFAPLLELIEDFDLALRAAKDKAGGRGGM